MISNVASAGGSVLHANRSGVVNAQSFDPVISGDGRFVVFRSSATNLVATTSNPPDVDVSELYLHDRETGTTSMISREADSGEPSGNKVALHVSGTASIDEVGRTAHLGDFEAQVDRMLMNVAALRNGSARRRAEDRPDPVWQRLTRPTSSQPDEACRTVIPSHQDSDKQNRMPKLIEILRKPRTNKANDDVKACCASVP